MCAVLVLNTIVATIESRKAVKTGLYSVIKPAVVFRIQLSSFISLHKELILVNRIRLLSVSFLWMCTILTCLYNLVLVLAYYYIKISSIKHYFQRKKTRMIQVKSNAMVHYWKTGFPMKVKRNL